MKLDEDDQPHWELEIHKCVWSFDELAVFAGNFFYSQSVPNKNKKVL